jgi:AcrR family transcriptional regulator
MSPRRAKVLSEESSPGALRRHLIAVTQRLLAAHGGTALTTRQIAREAQVSDGVLYNHFHDKDDLVVTALAAQAEENADAFLAAVPEPGSATLEQNLRALADAALALQASTLPLVTSVFGQARLLQDLVTAMHSDAGPLQPFVATVEYVRAEQALGRASADADAGAAVELLFGACQLRAFVGQLQPPDVVLPTGGPNAPQDLTAVVAMLVRALRP